MASVPYTRLPFEQMVSVHSSIAIWLINSCINMNWLSVLKPQTLSHAHQLPERGLNTLQLYVIQAAPSTATLHNRDEGYYY